MKTYSKPMMRIVRIQHSSIICASQVSSVSTNMTGDDNFTYGGGNNGAARVRDRSVWDDDWSE